MPGIYVDSDVAFPILTQIADADLRTRLVKLQLRCDRVTAAEWVTINPSDDVSDAEPGTFRRAAGLYIRDSKPVRRLGSPPHSNRRNRYGGRRLDWHRCWTWYLCPHAKPKN